MSFYFVKTPKIIQSYYKNYVWKINTTEKEIYLTFDDGPTPKVTDFVLDTLKKHQAKATFFCIGKNINTNPELFKRIISEGHSVGNHTNNHLNGWKNDVPIYVEDVEQTAKIISNFKNQSKINPEVSGQRLKVNDQKLFRPPYGKIKTTQANKLIKKNYKIIMWSVLSGDFDTNINTEKCLENVINTTENGSIIVFHDSEKAFKKLKNVLPKMLTHFSSLGFIFKAI